MEAFDWLKQVGTMPSCFKIWHITGACLWHVTVRSPCPHVNMTPRLAFGSLGAISWVWWYFVRHLYIKTYPVRTRGKYINQIHVCRNIVYLRHIYLRLVTFATSLRSIRCKVANSLRHRKPYLGHILRRLTKSHPSTLPPNERNEMMLF